MKIIALVVILLTSSCSLVTVDSQLVHLGTPQQALEWVSEHIKYKNDAVSEWQLPTRTYQSQTGDCEDYAMLLASALLASGETDVQIAACQLPNGDGHALVKWNGSYYEAQYGDAVQPYGPIMWVKSFAECLKWCR
jgi:predicted transglutaminase-like cysteine proteinase